MISLSRMMLETSLSQTGFSLLAAEPSEIGTLSLDSADLGLNLLTEQPSAPALQKVVDPPAAKERPLAGHSPSQDTTTQKASKTCILCDEPSVARKLYCKRHRQCFDCLSNDATAFKKKDPNSPEWLAWQRVMADPQASAKCILDFDRSFPVGGRGKKRGSIDWSEWVHEFRVEHSKSDRSNERKLDWEAFIPAVRAARGWTLERANVEWERLKGDKSVERDMGGYGDFKLRLFVPGNLLATDCVENAKSTVEAKKLAHGTKRKHALDTEELKAAQAELSIGFNKDSMGAQ